MPIALRFGISLNRYSIAALTGVMPVEVDVALGDVMVELMYQLMPVIGTMG